MHRQLCAQSQTLTARCKERDIKHTQANGDIRTQASATIPSGKVQDKISWRKLIGWRTRKMQTCQSKSRWRRVRNVSLRNATPTVFFSPWHKHACHLDFFLSNGLFTYVLSVLCCPILRQWHLGCDGTSGWAGAAGCGSGKQFYGLGYDDGSGCETPTRIRRTHAHVHTHTHTHTHTISIHNEHTEMPMYL